MCLHPASTIVVNFGCIPPFVLSWTGSHAKTHSTKTTALTLPSEPLCDFVRFASLRETRGVIQHEGTK
jgi:hypothetical protein